MGRKGKEIEDVFIGEGDEEREKSPFQERLGMVLSIGVVLVITFLIITFVGQRTHVSGDSMKNTLNHGDQLIVDKLTYRFQDPVRYDIIVFPYQYEENTFYIKRIIGLPGETVQIADGEIFINGEVLMESYGREVIQDPGTAAEPIRLGEDEYSLFIKKTLWGGPGFGSGPCIKQEFLSINSYTQSVFEKGYGSTAYDKSGAFAGTETAGKIKGGA